jgi:hypothetical protein
MAFFDLLRRIFGKKAPSQDFQAQIESPLESSVASSVGLLEEKSIFEPSSQSPESTSDDVLKDSFQLGLAAGYTGRSLKSIESSLTRVESQMPTKDWFSTQFEDKTPEFIEILKKHEENEQKRFELLQNLLASGKLPERSAELILHSAFPIGELLLTHKMQILVSIVKEIREISYKDLATRLGLTVSALRGLLSNTMIRTDKIERFRKDGKGWVRYKENDDSSTKASI